MGDDALDFQSLRLRGISWLQKYAGDEWTDYNVHDPGVTLLEALAYGLTDLAYRTDFKVADLLTRDGEELCLENLGLTAPDQAFPSRPATIDDWRVALLDAHEKLENVWVSPAGGDGEGGLISARLMARDVDDDAVKEDVRLAVAAAFDAGRNLGEDATDIQFATAIPCRLEVVAEVGRQRDPAEIAADIFERCSRQLVAGVPVVPYENYRRDRTPLDQVFLGPMGEFGMFDRKQLADGTGRDTIASAGQAPERFFRAVGQIEDVRFVESLNLRLPEPAPGDHDGIAFYDLKRPETAADVRSIVLKSRGRTLSVDPARMSYFLDRLAARRAEQLRPKQDTGSIVSLPTGRHRDVDNFRLVQTELPRAYRVTAQGLSRTAPDAVLGRSRQLRGYMLHFEQCLADYLAGLNTLPDLYAAAETRDTYPVSNRVREALPAQDRDLYPDSATGMRDVGGDYRDDFDRRKRTLDYLLALYGEAFSQNSLRTFDLYRIGQEHNEALLKNREAFLADIQTLTRDRGAGANLRFESDPGGFARRLALLLDMRPAGAGAAAEAWPASVLSGRKGDYYWDEIAAVERHARVRRDRLEVPTNPMDGAVLLSDDGLHSEIDGLITDLRAYDLMTIGPVHPSLMSFGAILERYSICPGEGGWWLVLDDGDPADMLVVGLFRAQASANRVANLLRRLTVRLSKASEGLYVVEHIMLRQRCQQPKPAAAKDHGRVSIVMTGWTARAKQSGFRELAEETARLNCPAHLISRCVWLESFDELLRFEGCYRRWRHALAEYRREPANDKHAVVVDAASEALREALDAASVLGG